MKTEILELPLPPQDLINHYLNLKIGEVTVPTPYYRNVKRVRAELRSLIGKGLPDEIEEEVLIYSKLRDFTLSEKSPKELREFMRSQGIGIDCSGFISHIYDVWLRARGYRGISSYLKFPYNGLYRRLMRILRPIENISADTLTSDQNTIKVKYENVRPGDLLRLKGAKRGDHVAMIYRTERFGKHLRSLTYVHSKESEDESDGVSFGTINIVNQSAGLEKQEWVDDNRKGKSKMLEGFLREKEDNGLRRPLFLEHLNSQEL